MPYKNPEDRKKYREKNKVKLREYDKQYRAANPEKIKKQSREAALRYYYNNQERLIEEARVRNQTEEWKQYQKEWYEQNKEAISKKDSDLWANDEDFRNKKAEYTKARRQEILEFLNSLKAESGCLYCEENDPACLDFHHVDPSKKVAAVSEMAGGCYRKETIEVEITKCEVLCSNCHRKLHYGRILTKRRVECQA